MSVPGCVVLLIDDSAAMLAKPPLQERALAADAATAINSLLKQLGDGPDFPIALVGYSDDPAAGVRVGSRWGGAFAGRDFVNVSELAAAPIKVETRVRKIPGRPDESIAFPIWYEPASAGKSPQVAAFDHVARIVGEWTATATDAGPPLVIHVCGSGSSDGNPAKAIKDLQALGTGTLVFHAHLGLAPNVPPTLFSANRAFLPIGAIRDTFDRASPLTPEMIADLKAAQLVVNAGARGLVYNGKLTDLVRCLGLVKTHVKKYAPVAVPVFVPPTPTPAAKPSPPPKTSPGFSVQTLADDAPPMFDDFPIPVESYGVLGDAEPAPTGTDPARLLVLVLDRSLADPYSADPTNVFGKLQERANEILNKFALKADSDLQLGVTAYGMDAVGMPEVRTGFEGALVGRPLVPAAELRDGAIRTEEVVEEVPNGVGGILTIKRTKLTFLEMDPAASCPPAAAFQEASGLLDAWYFDHADPITKPIILHLTRGAHTGEDLRDAVALVSARAAVYHLVATEGAHPSVTYPESPDELQSSELQAIYEASSPFVDAFPANPAVKPGSRGVVVNGKFDALIAPRT